MNLVKKLTSFWRRYTGLSFYIILSGWIIFGGFLLIEYANFNPHSIDYVLDIRYPASALHLVMLLFPFISTALGYLVNERMKLHAKAQSYQARLENSLSSWKVTFDSMPYGAAIIDKDYNILKANSFAAGIRGAAVREIANRKCHEIFECAIEGTNACPIVKSLKSFKTETAEHYDRLSGRWFMLNASPFIDDDGFNFVYSIVDITDIKKKEKKLTDSKDAFFNMLKDLDASNKEMKALFNGLIFAFADALDAKSRWTRGHSERVTAYALSIAKEMELPEAEIEVLKIAAILHDIGKIGTYDAILDKPGRLTPEEFDLVKMHPGKGAEILRHIRQLESVVPVLRHHHERIDGMGYPDGLKGDEIPLLARILCVADSFDSMTADRPYRSAPGREFAVEELQRCSGKQFDSVVVDAFLRLLQPEAAMALSH